MSDNAQATASDASARDPLLLGIDIGSTNAKVAAYAGGRLMGCAARPMPLRRTPDGAATFGPEQVFDVVCDAVREVTDALDRPKVAAIGVTSMAETGLLLDPATGSPRTPLIPWFDVGASDDAARLREMRDPFERFSSTGLWMNHKAGLAKIISTMRHRGASVAKGAKWLSTADFIVYRLAGATVTDATLAARTQAFDIHRRTWDGEWLSEAGLCLDHFPDVLPSGATAGSVGAEIAAACGLPAGTPVAVAGHDHVVAAYALDILTPGRVLDSMGTAESMVGAMDPRGLTLADMDSGLVFGPHVVPEALFWLGALAASGGSIEWLRSMLADPYVSYEHLLGLLARAPAGPAPILYFPYLAGAQAPQPDGGARGAFVGLTANHTASDLALAVLQGAAYEMERIRRTAESVAGPVDRIVAAGGGTRIRRWLQLKADVSGKPIVVSQHAEAAALGAALLAGVGGGIYRDHAEAHAALGLDEQGEGEAIQPDPVEHRLHLRLLQGPYAELQAPLRAASRSLANALREEEAQE